MLKVVWLSQPPLLDDAALLLDHFIKIAYVEVKTIQTDDPCLSPSVLEVCVDSINAVMFLVANISDECINPQLTMVRI